MLVRLWSNSVIWSPNVCSKKYFYYWKRHGPEGWHWAGYQSPAAPPHRPLLGTSSFAPLPRHTIPCTAMGQHHREPCCQWKQYHVNVNIYCPQYHPVCQHGNDAVVQPLQYQYYHPIGTNILIGYFTNSWSEPSSVPAVDRTNHQRPLSLQAHCAGSLMSATHYYYY